MFAAKSVASQPAGPDPDPDPTGDEGADPAPLSNPSCTLETLPVEMRLEILLSLPDLESLKTAVHASTVLYQQYALDRRRILGHFLEAELGSVFVDAYAVQTSTSLCLPDDELLEHSIFENFLGGYVDWRSRPDAVLQQCIVDDLAGMASFYLSVVQPFLQYFPAVFLGNLGSSLEVGRLNKTERVRFLRALYRFQLTGNLFRRVDTYEFGELAQLMANNNWEYSLLLANVLSADVQELRHALRTRGYRSNHDVAQDAREKLPFSGNTEDGPPVAWAIIWRGIYGNWYGRMISYSLQKWGYVFWDVKRIVKTGGKQRLQQSCAPAWSRRILGIDEALDRREIDYS
jgi:hypothetical protein